MAVAQAAGDDDDRVGTLLEGVEQNLDVGLAVARRANLPPDDAIALVGIEAAEVEAFGEVLTPVVAAAVSAAADEVVTRLDNRWRSSTSEAR